MAKWTHKDQSRLLRAKQARLKIKQGVLRLERKGRRNWSETDTIAYDALKESLATQERYIRELEEQKRNAE